MWLYVLALEDNCFYIGISANVSHRIEQHFKGKGAVFTKKHKPLAVVSNEICNPKCAKKLERDLVLKYQAKYGKDKVRGAGHTF